MPSGARTAWTRSSEAVEATEYSQKAAAYGGPNAADHGGGGRRVGFHTFGCKLNQFETEALASSFKTHGFTIVPFEQEADAYVINTCTVTCRADHKARALIRSLARSRSRSLLIVTGCSAELNRGELSSLGANVLVVPQSQKARLLDLPKILARPGQESTSADMALRDIFSPVTVPRDIFSAVTVPRDIFSLTAGVQNFRSRAYLKVQDGCDSRCSYCRVPLARGPSVSLGPDEALRRARELEELGYREVVITGVNIASYNAETIALHQLLRLLLDATRRVRFRLSSLEPEAITEALGAVIVSRRICPHFHIPVQSGSDGVLARMNRRSRRERIREAVALLRSSKEDPCIAADIMTGFPGETADDFAQTRSLVEELSFAALHVFPFSPRPGTEASDFKPSVPERTRHQRARELRALGRLSASSYARSWVGREVEVLLEGQEGARAWGVSGNYLKVDVSGVPCSDEVEGSIVRARITSAHGTCRSLFLGIPAI